MLGLTVEYPLLSVVILHRAHYTVVEYLLLCLFVLQDHKWIWGNQEICAHKVSTQLYWHVSNACLLILVFDYESISRSSWTSFYFCLLSLVAIYLGIKKRPSPGPSDVAGIWEAVGSGTLRRWYWLCGRRRWDVAARSTMPAPFCSPAPMAWQGAAWPLRPRCAIFRRATQRLLMGCATRDYGGRR